MLVIGFGVGTFLTSVVTLLTIGLASKPSQEGKAQAKRTVDLLEERNAIDARIDSRLATLQEWALQNWKP